MAKLLDITLSIVDGRDVVDTYEEEAVRVDQLGAAMDQLVEVASEEYNLTDFAFQFTFE